MFKPGRRGTETIQLAPGLTRLRLHNLDPDGELVVRIERAEWLDNIVTAAELTIMPEFRAHFSSEVLSPDVEIGVKRLTVLFTDLKSSTEYYNKLGDASAFRVVKEHFDVLESSINAHNGSIVKTIGDSVMAVFRSPDEAVLAAIRMHEAIRQFNGQLPLEKRVIVKSGMHDGPALAVNLNDKLDYFGHTVNLAARTNGQSKGADVVMTETVYSSTEVQVLLEEKSLGTMPFHARLKGFPDDFTLHRLVL
jgi:class 3 adenylate cyclase